MSNQNTAFSPNDPCERLPDDSKNVLNIPKNSFTSFRLSYASSAEVSHFATSIFIGKVPDVWNSLSNKAPIFSLQSSKRLKAGFWIPRAVSEFKNRLSGSTKPGGSKYRDHESILSNEFGQAHSYLKPSSIWESMPIKGSSKNESEVCPGSDKTFSELSDKDVQTPLSKKSSCSRQITKDASNRCVLAYRNTSSESVSKSKSKLDCLNTAPKQSDQGCNEIITDTAGHFQIGTNWKSFSQTSQRIHPKLAKLSVETTTGEPSGLLSNSPDQLNYRILQESKARLSSRPKPFSRDLITRESLPKETFGEKREGKIHKVQFANPIPEKHLNSNHSEDEYAIAERQHRRTIRKLRSLAFRSKEGSRLSNRSFKLNFFDDDLSNRRPGEILQMDKMLVMIKKISNVSSLPSVNEQSDLSSAVQDNWREYYVVLRLNEQSPASFVIQLFDAGKRRDLNGNPEHCIVLNKQARADLFSHTDKTLSITSLVNEEIKILIMNTRYYNVAYKWLGIIKDLLNEDMFPILAINLADTRAQLKVTVPIRLIGNAALSLKSIKLHQRRFGYEVERDELLKFIISRVKAYGSELAKSSYLINQNLEFSFCFRYYDRIEWLPVDGATILAQSQFLQDHGILEYRQVPKEKLFSKTDSKTSILRPFPIEGFLSRITNSAGKEGSRLQTFYKIQYFFSCDNILFFSSFSQGLPPSPHNNLLKKNADRKSICFSIPDVYYVNPYALDQNEHIPWLSGADFEKYDKEAAVEFSRKLQLIVGARAMVDLAMISFVKPIPMKSLQARHLYFQSYLWYSSPTILEDVKCVDSGFEISLLNGSSLQLLAPSMLARDEWVSRLNDLAVYWKSKSTESQNSMTSGKLRNMEHLGSKDDVDSNLLFGSNSLEKASSVAISSRLTLSGLAMSTQVLCSGYLYQKQKKHSSFNQYFVVLCPGHLIIFSVFKRSKITVLRTSTPYYERYMTIPVSECYVYSGSCSRLDLVEPQGYKSTGSSSLPRMYPDGWRSSEEDYMKCFSIWFGGKRALRNGVSYSGLNSVQVTHAPKNPGIIHMTRKSGVTGKIIVFLARSRQEREHWVYNILQEINRFS